MYRPGMDQEPICGANGSTLVTYSNDQGPILDKMLSVYYQQIKPTHCVCGEYIRKIHPGGHPSVVMERLPAAGK